MDFVGRKAILQTDLRRVGRTWERVRRAATGPGPIAARDYPHAGNDAVDGLMVMRLEMRLRRIQGDRLIGDGIRMFDDRRRVEAACVEDSSHDGASYRRAVQVLRNRHHGVVVGVAPSWIVSSLAVIVALPATAEADITPLP